jgi:hypothetical protein
MDVEYESEIKEITAKSVGFNGELLRYTSTGTSYNFSRYIVTSDGSMISACILESAYLLEVAVRDAPIHCGDLAFKIA